MFQAPLRNRSNGTNAQRLYNARSILVAERLGANPRVRFHEYRASLQHSDVGARRSSRLAEDSSSHLRDEVMRQVHEGYISRAASLASSPGLAPYCEATAQRLRDLWNSPSHRESREWSSPDAPTRARILADLEQKLRKSLRTASRGSGAGLSGWRFEYLFPLLRAAGHTWGPFAQLMSCIAVGDAPLWVREILSLGRATALKKKDNGVRPLVCHEPLRRLITRSLIFAASDDIKAFLGPYQFAVGTAGGCHALALSVQKLAEKHSNMVFFKLDLENAYNKQCREDALENVSLASPSLASFLRQFYGSESKYFYRTSRTSHTIVNAAEGIEQGDAAGPALFACGLKKPLDELRARLQNLLSEERERRAMARNDSREATSENETDVEGCVAVFAYLDDTIIGVPPELAGAALTTAVEAFASAGHTVHPGKSACWSHSAEHGTLPECCQRIWQGDGLKVGGIPVFNASHDPVLVRQILEKRLDNIEKEANFYSSILFDDQMAAAESWSRAQSVILLLRYSLAAKLVYFGQTIDPIILEPFARRFDEIVLRTFLKILAIDQISEDQKLQIQLALRDGGCGVRAHDLKELQRLYVASALLVAPAVHAATGERIGAGAPAEEGRSYEHQLSSSLNDLIAFGCTRPDFSDGGALSADTWSNSVSLKFKKILLTKIDHLHRMLPLEDSERARARLKSCSGPGAQWLAALPTSPKSTFTDEDFRAVIRFRLGLETNDLQICPHISAEGVQCEAACDRYGYHLQQCPSGGGYFVGHDTVCAEFGDLAGGSEGIPGVVVDWKSQVAAWPRSTRGYEADLGLFHIPGERDIYLDGVLSLANPRTYRGCENKAGKVAELWARRKNLDHPVFDRNTGRRLHPFDFRALAFERHGFIAKETAALIRKLAHLKAAHFELDPSEETRRWYVALSCCVQRANAKILRGEAVPGRGASIPSRLLSGNRDLAVCGS